MADDVQIIYKNGHPEYVVIPYFDYMHIIQQLTAEGKELKVREAEDMVRDRIIGNYENPIKAWRKFRKLTQTGLAKDAGISVGYLSQLETGVRTPSLETLQQLSRVLAISISDLTGEIR